MSHWRLSGRQMTGAGSVLPGAAGLVVTVDGEAWRFTLRRADLRPAEIFFEYHGKEIRAADVARFLRNWRSLAWTQVPSGLLSRMELSAVDGEYQISLSADAPHEVKRDELIAAFLLYMK